MSVHVVLLSAINTGRRKATSADLKTLCLHLGWTRAETLLASGNIIIDTGRQGAAKVSARLEAAIETEFGFEARAIVRSGDDLDDVIARLPYKTFTPKLMLVNFLDAVPTKAGITALDAFNAGREEYVIDGREMFIRYENGVAETKLTPPVIRRKLGVTGTARNWNTVGKLRDRARSMEAA